MKRTQFSPTGKKRKLPLRRKASSPLEYHAHTSTWFCTSPEQQSQLAVEKQSTHTQTTTTKHPRKNNFLRKELINLKTELKVKLWPIINCLQFTKKIIKSIINSDCARVNYL